MKATSSPTLTTDSNGSGTPIRAAIPDPYHSIAATAMEEAPSTTEYITDSTQLERVVARRYRRLRRSNWASVSCSWLNSCTTSTPSTRSDRNAFTPANASRSSRNRVRSRRRSSSSRASSGGDRRTRARVKRASSQSMAARVPPIVSTSSRIPISPELNASPRASTSLVARVRRRPAGWRSRKRWVRPSRCR